MGRVLRGRAAGGGLAPCALWAWACLWAVGRGGAGCHCHGHCQQPRATASTMATPSQQGATWGWWSGGTEPEIGGAGPAGARGRQMPAGAAASQQQQTAGGCGGEARPLLNKRLLLGISGEPKVALRSKGLVPEGRGAVKFLHAGLLLQGPPPTSTSKEHAAVEARCCRP